MVAFYGSHDASNKLRNQILWNNQIKKQIWTEIVANKISKQSEFLKEQSHEEEYRLLEHYIAQIKEGDITNREGHAAKVYFNAVFGMEFTREDGSVYNSALNYGYTVLLSLFNREIVSQGYNTQLGLFHDNMFNYFNLSSDLMEPFRILIDRKVIELKLKAFDKEEKYALINFIDEKVKINGRNQYINQAIKIYTRSVFEALNKNNPSIIKFYEMGE